MNTMKDGAYVINFDEHKSIETYWIALCVNGNCLHNSVTYFDSFEVHLFLKKLKNLEEIKVSPQVFLEYIVKDKSLTLLIYFPVIILRKNDKIILNYFLN